MVLEDSQSKWVRQVGPSFRVSPVVAAIVNENLAIAGYGRHSSDIDRSIFPKSELSVGFSKGKPIIDVPTVAGERI